MKCKPSLGSFRVGYSPTTRCLKPIVRNKRNTRVKGDCSWITNGHGFMSNRRKVSYSSSCFSFCLTWSHVNVKIEQILWKAHRFHSRVSRIISLEIVLREECLLWLCLWLRWVSIAIGRKEPVANAWNLVHLKWWSIDAGVSAPQKHPLDPRWENRCAPLLRVSSKGENRQQLEHRTGNAVTYTENGPHRLHLPETANRVSHYVTRSVFSHKGRRFIRLNRFG